MSKTTRIEIPESLKSLFYRRYRFLIYPGGRGAGRSRNVAAALVIRSMTDAPIRIVCARVVQDKVAYSSQTLIRDAIRAHGEATMRYFRNFETASGKIRNDYGSEFMFVGLASRFSSIRSLEGADIFWLDEGQDMNSQMWDDLTPTIRKKGSQIICTFNTDVPSFLRDEFVVNEVKRKNAYVKFLTSYDNPYFSDTELVEEREFDREYRPKRYKKVWLGQLVDDDDIILHPHWFKGYTKINQVLSRCNKYLFVADTACKDEKIHDWSVAQVWGFEGRKRAYLIDQIRGRWQFLDLKLRVREFYDQWAKRVASRPIFYIEDRMSGIQLIQTLRYSEHINNKYYKSVNVRTWLPQNFGLKRLRTGSTQIAKADRVDMILSIIVRGCVWLPAYAPFLREFMAEAKDFRADGSHHSDDQVDALTMALMTWLRWGGGRYVID